MTYIILQFSQSFNESWHLSQHITKIILQHDGSEGCDKSEDIWSQGQTSAFTRLQQESYATLGSSVCDSQEYHGTQGGGRKVIQPSVHTPHVHEVTAPNQLIYQYIRSVYSTQLQKVYVSSEA